MPLSMVLGKRIMSSIFKADLPNRADLSQFLIHLTKDGTYDFYDAKVGPPPGFERVFRPVRARDSLKDMLTSKKIEARSPFGYFRLKINMYRSRFGRVFQNADANPDWMKAVCFSETPLRELKYFYQAVSKKRNQYRKFGLAFWQEKIREKGGNPIFYVDSRRPEYLKALDDSLLNNGVSFIPLMPFIETFGPLVISGASGYSDFRWEREWRKQGELNFEFEDVAFGICPANEIPAFEALVGGSFIFIDPDWDEQTLKAVLSAKAKHLLQQF
jgi:hypothetical protein